MNDNFFTYAFVFGLNNISFKLTVAWDKILNGIECEYTLVDNNALV